MGMGSEFLADHAFELQYPFGVASDVWTTKDGRQIAVKDMTTQHILNCMRIVGEDDGWYSVFESELEKRQVKAVIKMDERIEKATTDKPNEERLYTHDEVLCCIRGACRDGQQGYDPYDLLIEDYLDRR